MRNSVVLPHPLGPTIMKNSPWAMSTETPSTAMSCPNVLHRSRMRMAGGSAAVRRLRAWRADGSWMVLGASICRAKRRSQPIISRQWVAVRHRPVRCASRPIFSARIRDHWAASRNRTLRRHRRCPRLSISPCVLNNRQQANEHDSSSRPVPGARAIFLETGSNPQLAEQVATETGITVVTELYSHSVTEADGAAPTIWTRRGPTPWRSSKR